MKSVHLRGKHAEEHDIKQTSLGSPPPTRETPYKPNHPAAAVYSDLVDEFLDKVDQLEKKGQR